MTGLAVEVIRRSLAIRDQAGVRVALVNERADPAGNTSVTGGIIVLVDCT